MMLSNQLDGELMRVRVAMIFVVLAFLFLAATLWRTQVYSSSEYKDSLHKQSLRRVRLPGARGSIFDRNGVCLAGNRPSYCIAIYVEELRQAGKLANTIDAVEHVIDGLARDLNLQRTATRKEIESHVNKRRPLPFIAWRDVDHAVLARFAESAVTLPGVDIYVESIRSYPFGGLGAHVLGYLGRLDPDKNEEEEDDQYHFYVPEMEGNFGMEKVCNSTLAGMPGGRLLCVDASGFKHNETSERAPVAGSDVTLTIDFRIQRLLEEALGDNRAAGVVLDPRNGEVLALASSPAFNPNSFSTGIQSDDWGELNTDTNRPMINRAITGMYPPGSTFKPLVAIAAIDGTNATENMSFSCPGVFRLGETSFHCWQKRGHGWLAMRKAIEQSCNCYFCQLGLLCGPNAERIQQTARAAGMGRVSGIELVPEAAGLVPTPAWKRRAMKDEWRQGDTCNMSIGQGALLVTPLQMAVMVSAIANGGTVFRPRLVMRRSAKPEVANQTRWSQRAMRVVRGGMNDVVQSTEGTGKRAAVPGVALAAKTGTAEYGPKDERKKHTWMIAFAPFESPRYAAAIVVEDGISGGITVAPKMGALMKGIFTIEGLIKPEEATN
ncbi:MAG: penicillin-binding protein 2 [Verrucomicrobia bacterium]|nr:penicillin-binding protein 2 [Verrucomicrobiota bacterium]